MARGDLIFIFRLLLVGLQRQLPWARLLRVCQQIIIIIIISLYPIDAMHHLLCCITSTFSPIQREAANMEIWDILQIESVSLRCCTYQIRERDTHDKWQDILLISGSSHVSSSLCVFKIDSTRRAGESHPEKTANVDRDTLPSVNTAVCRECWCAHKRARRKKK